MEQHDPTQRQYAPNAYSAQPPHQPSGAMPPQYTAPPSTERFRQHPSYFQQSPQGPSPAARAGNEAQQVYGFAQNQYGQLPTMPSTILQYGQGMDTQSAPRQQTQSQYQSYGSNLMYGMAQPQAQTQPAQTAYEQVPQYRQRPGAASETVPTRFGVPQTTQYYLAGQTGPTSAPASEIAGQQLPTQYQQTPYSQTAVSAPQTYPSTMIDPSQGGQYAAYAQQPQYTAQQPTRTVDQAFNEYQTRIRSIFTLVRDGTLRDVGTNLIQISQYLMGNAEALGLTRDDEALHDDRIRLWDEFNRAWLTTLQRQHDMTEDMYRTNQAVQEPYSLMNSQALEQLSRELVRLCDMVERFGLVDYQMGVQEEEIMDLWSLAVLLRCLTLLDPSGERAGEAAAATTVTQHGTSSSSSSRPAARGR
ncbi:hypothetical protein D0864_11485 [Hortaea werneckii]|uniref:Uncharacterized protein n=1 Tax=Hortaea werneckii TaxID=91943 RepID=A0A3M7DUC6_HORWE|nr:hypothetical protein D0864_11485 [Hortaea werneckii]